MDARYVRRTVVSAHLLLVLTVIGSSVVNSGGFARGLGLVIPLLLPWRGLIKGHRYTYAWATLCVIPYFVFGTVEAVANPAARVWPALVLALSLTLFAGLILYLRLTRMALS